MGAKRLAAMSDADVLAFWNGSLGYGLALVPKQPKAKANQETRAAANASTAGWFLFL
jgi:hypothetical protein